VVKGNYSAIALNHFIKRGNMEKSIIDLINRIIANDKPLTLRVREMLIDMLGDDELAYIDDTDKQLAYLSNLIKSGVLND
jgi:hypothetical protein